MGMDLPRADLGAEPAYLGQGGLADFRSHRVMPAPKLSQAERFVLTPPGSHSPLARAPTTAGAPWGGQGPAPLQLRASKSGHRPPNYVMLTFVAGGPFFRFHSAFQGQIPARKAACFLPRLGQT